MIVRRSSSSHCQAVNLERTRTGWLDEIMATLAAMFHPQGFPARDREIMALRISTLLGAEYPVPQLGVFA